MNATSYSNDNYKVLLPDHTGYRNEPFKNIYYFKANGRFIEVFISRKKSYTSNISLKKLEEMLPKNLFVRIHRGYIVNILYVYRIDIGRDRIILENDNVLPLSRRKKNQLLECLKNISSRNALLQA